MREIKLRFDDHENGKNVVMMTDFGNRSEASTSENIAADQFEKKIRFLLATINPDAVRGMGMGETVEEASGLCDISMRIKEELK